jgi:hypothetical protein
MNRIVRGLTGFAVAAAAAATVGCEATKSENPLSPNVAGPIAGVNIEIPAPVSPSGGSEVVNTSPVRLVFNNATTNGVRPIWYVVELASDAGFESKLFTNGKVTPAEGAQTTVVVDGTLSAERTYWRVKAADGANESSFSPPAHFELVVPVVIEAPVPVSPANGETTSTNSPTLRVNNGRVQGRAGNVEYRFFVARDQHFSQGVAEIPSPRVDGSSTSVQTAALPVNTLLFWRVVASNGTIRDTSTTQTFRTPAPAGGGGGGGGGGGYVPPPSPAPGGRTPDPPPGGRLPLPDMSGVVHQIAQQYPGALRNSCQDHGGTWEFMDRVVDELRKYDSRWGYNGKRGNVGDPSHDVVDYHWGRGADENSTEVYIIDIIGGHCGGSPTPGWFDVTDVTHNNGTIGRWTGRGRF